MDASAVPARRAVARVALARRVIAPVALARRVLACAALASHGARPARCVARVRTQRGDAANHWLLCRGRGRGRLPAAAARAGPPGKRTRALAHQRRAVVTPRWHIRRHYLREQNKCARNEVRGRQRTLAAGRAPAFPGPHVGHACLRPPPYRPPELQHARSSPICRPQKPTDEHFPTKPGGKEPASLALRHRTPLALLPAEQKARTRLARAVSATDKGTSEFLEARVSGARSASETGAVRTRITNSGTIS